MPVMICTGFDQVFLEKVQSIQTDKDREDAILELQQFVVRFPLSA